MFDAKQGWVSTLVQNLERLLAQKLGRTNSFSIWWDETDLRGNHEINPEIQDKVQDSATLLLVNSSGYLASTWCRREMELFFQSLKQRTQGRVFVVELQPLDEGQAESEELANLKGYRFWYRDEHKRTRTLSIRAPEPHKTDYTQLVEDLAYDISGQLKAVKAGMSAVASEPKATVYLAEVTDDLEPRREQVRRYLEREEIRVLPARRYLEGQAFQEALDEDLKQCKLFIQLLSDIPGRRPPDTPQGYAWLQLERAKALKLPILQWRDQTLVMEEMESKEQRELLKAETVYAESLEIFKQRVVDAAIRPKPQAPAPIVVGAPFVFINAERRDQILAETIRDRVATRTATTLPIRQGTAMEIREDLEQKLRECDALIIVYGVGTVGWVDRQLLYCNKILPDRDRYLRALGVYEGPPEEKPEVPTRMPGLQILSCRRGLDEQKLQAFLTPLLEGTGR